MPNEARQLTTAEIEALATSGALDADAAAGLLRHGARDAALDLEERARAKHLPPPAEPGDLRSAAERAADAVAAHVEQRKFRVVPSRPAYTPQPATPALSSQAIEAAQKRIAGIEADIAATEPKMADLEHKADELQLLVRSGEDRAAAARLKQNRNDRTALAFEAGDLRRELVTAQRQLSDAIAVAEADRRDTRVLELKAKWDVLVSASEKIDAALKLLDDAAHIYLTESRDLHDYRDLRIQMPTFDMLSSATRLNMAVANAGPAVQKLLGGNHVPLSQRESFADLARRGAASVRAAQTRKPS